MMKSRGQAGPPLDLLAKYDRPGPRYTSYPTAPTWSKDIGHDDYVSALKSSGQNSTEPMALYIHIPFCVKRCYFCGCNTVIAKMSDRVNHYVKVLCHEIDKVADLTGNSRPISQLHFGGGTPSFVDRVGLGAIMDKLESRFKFQSNCETSIEVDPRVTTVEMLEFLVERGFNRISLGVQDFDEAVQKAVGRIQPAEMVRELLDECRRLKLSGINFDLIYGLPHQNVESFGRTLDSVIEMRPDRVAVYSFAFLPSLKPHQLRIHTEDLPPTEVKYQLFTSALEKFIEAGYHQIGMDHFALPDDELSLARHDGRLNRNFMGYTVQASADMIGLGMSSIGYVGNTFFQNSSLIDSYQSSFEEDRFAVYRGKQLSEDDLVRQYVISSLMCNFRLDYDDFKTRFGFSYGDYFGNQKEALSEMFDDGLVTETDNCLEVTRLGRCFVRNIAMTFDTYLSENATEGQPQFSRTI